MADEANGCECKCPCPGDKAKAYADTYNEQWSRGIGSRKKTLEICFDPAEHKDGTKLKIARLMPNMVFDDIKLRVKAAMPGVTFDLGFTDLCRGCCCTEEGQKDLKWFADGLSLAAKKECLLEGGPWDAASGHCAPECCDLPLKECPEVCPDESRPGPECSWDMILTVHGDVPECACLVLTFDYHNE